MSHGEATLQRQTSPRDPVGDASSLGEAKSRHVGGGERRILCYSKKTWIVSEPAAGLEADAGLSFRSKALIALCIWPRLLGPVEGAADGMLPGGCGEDEGQKTKCGGWCRGPAQSEGDQSCSSRTIFSLKVESVSLDLPEMHIMQVSMTTTHHVIAFRPSQSHGGVWMRESEFRGTVNIVPSIFLSSDLRWLILISVSLTGVISLGGGGLTYGV